MKVVVYWEDSQEQRIAENMIGPLRARVTGIVHAAWQQRGGPGPSPTPTVEVEARSRRIPHADDPDYVQALERAVFAEEHQ